MNLRVINLRRAIVGPALRILALLVRLPRPRAVVADIEIEPPVIVVVSKRRAGCISGTRYVIHSHLVGHIFEDRRLAFGVWRSGGAIPNAECRMPNAAVMEQ